MATSTLPNSNHASPRSNPEATHMGQAPLKLNNPTSAADKHRQSLSELRYPPSPRSHRLPSLPSLAVQELIDNPPTPSNPDPKFAGRDWRTVKISELISPEDLEFVDVDTPVETATNLLINSNAPVLLVRESADSPRVVGIFDYNTLNAYLLMVLGLLPAGDEQAQHFSDLITKAREGKSIPLKDVKDLGRKESLEFLSESTDLIRAIETFGKGVHRALVTSDHSNEVVGVLSQGKLTRFLWENGRAFPAIERLFAQHLRDLRIGSSDVIAVNGDQPLHKALALMAEEGVSSLAVVDNARNVVGNISTVDCRLLTKSSSLPLLENTCIHFISVILSTRGMYEGKDSFPVFHVTPLNTLAHTFAKLVATKSHRLWVTDENSLSSSGPSTPPTTHSATMVPTSSHRSSFSVGSGQSYLALQPPVSADANHVADGSLKTSPIAMTGPSVSASSLPGLRMSGHLVGVVSLTDILILFARTGGMSVADPQELRLRRRRSSSSSVRRSVDLGGRPPRPSSEFSRHDSNH